MKLKLTALSPIHVGNGREYDPFDFYFESNKVLILNNAACMDALYEDDPLNIEVYLEWVEETTKKISQAKSEAIIAGKNKDKSKERDKNQIIADLRKNFNIIDFCQSKLNNNHLAQKLKTDERFHNYQAYCPYRPRNVQKLKQAIKTGKELYIPGSSIKGLLRTALAYKIIKELTKEESADFLRQQDRNGEGIKQILKKIKTAYKNAAQANKNNEHNKYELYLREANRLRKGFEKRIGGEAEKFLFGCDDGQGKLDDAKFDIMRLISVSDTQKGNFSVLIQEMKSFTLNKRNQDMNAQPIALTEFIDTNSEFEFEINVDVGLIQKIIERKDWVGFEQKFCRLFGISVSELTGLEKDELEKKIIERILQAVRELGKAILQKEKKWLQQFRNRDKENLELFLKQIPVNKSVAKIGFASGWFATTVGLAIMQNENLKDFLSDILYAFNLDLTIKKQKIMERSNLKNRDRERQLKLLQREPNANTFPKSRRLTAEKRTASEYIGWIAIEKGRLSESSKNTKVKKEETRNYDDMEEALMALKKHFEK